MDFYSLHGITLEVKQEGHTGGLDLGSLLGDLSFVPVRPAALTSSVSLSVQLSDQPVQPPDMAVEVFQQDGLRGLATEDGFCLSEGSSVFHILPSARRGRVTLTPGFFEKAALLQQQFWAFGLLRLLRPLSVFGLHAAGIVSPAGQGMLIVGASGSGKSTLAIGLIEHGWGYASDDAVLLRVHDNAVETLALRKPFSIAIDAMGKHPEETGPDRHGTGPTPTKPTKRRVDIRDECPQQFVPGFVPQTVLFPCIVKAPHSDLLAVDRVTALQWLLEQSGPQLFDKATMGRHMDILNRLVRQCGLYALHAGRDLYRNPTQLVSLLAARQGERDDPDHRRTHESL